MIESRVASRYARSLLNLAIEQGKLEEAFKEMKLIGDTFESSRDLQLLLESPIIKVDKKISIIKAIFKGKLSKFAEDFVSIIVRKRREGYLCNIVTEFQAQYRQKNKFITAVVTSAVGLDAEMRNAVLKLVQDSTKSEVELVEKKDPDLIGGLILKIGDKQYDGSLQRSLNDLRKELNVKKYLAN